MSYPSCSNYADYHLHVIELHEAPPCKNFYHGIGPLLAGSMSNCDSTRTTSSRVVLTNIPMALRILTADNRLVLMVVPLQLGLVAREPSTIIIEMTAYNSEMSVRFHLYLVSILSMINRCFPSYVPQSNTGSIA